MDSKQNAVDIGKCVSIAWGMAIWLDNIPPICLYEQVFQLAAFNACMIMCLMNNRKIMMQLLLLAYLIPLPIVTQTDLIFGFRRVKEIPYHVALEHAILIYRSRIDYFEEFLPVVSPTPLSFMFSIFSRLFR